MRRRDATHSSFHLKRRAGWPAAMSVGLSLSVHAALLALATTALLPGSRPTDLIRVSLASGGGTGAPARASAATPAQPWVQPQPAHAQPAARTRPKPVRPKRPPSIIGSGNAPALQEPNVESATLAASGGEPGASSGTGSGSGFGVGAGSGQSAGSGAGAGFDERPYCVRCPAPRYPLVARVRGWQGSVDVGLLVLADGSVDGASLRRSSGYGVLDAAAIAVARQSRFRPPAAQGLPTPLRGRIEYRFELTTSR